MKNSLEPGINFYDYVKNNAFADTRGLILAMRDKCNDFSVEFAVTQIECRRKTQRKLMAFLSEDRFLFPSLLAAEQSTHQCVAAYHAMFVGKDKKILDMTAGLGIDAFTMARAGNRVTAVELDPHRAEVLEHNARLDSNGPVEVIEGDSIAWLSGNPLQRHFDIIFVDPARRDSDNRRTYFFKDCLPDIVSSFDVISASADKILIKASPIIDITQAVREVPGVSAVHIVCVKGECKEVLLVSEPEIKTDTGDIDIVAVDIDETPDLSVRIISRLSFKMSSLVEKAPLVTLTDIIPGTFLYDPNAAVHKLNCAGVLCNAYKGLKKISYNTDLYWSTDLKRDFPGRVFRIVSIPDKSALRSLAGAKCEVATRNYPLTSDQLRKKLNVRSGMTDFIFGCKAGEKGRPMLIKCSRVVIEMVTNKLV